MIQFILNQKLISTETPSGENLLQFIREHQHLKGTKVGCREGDCGACTVLVGTLVNNAVEYRTVTSCLASLASVAGKHVVTVEGLNLSDGLNQAQQAIHDHSATQCGFCTPGFVVSMTSIIFDNPKQYQPDDAISGNICRCTGYKSIEKSVNQLDRILNKTEHSLSWYIQNRFIPEYFKEIPERLMLTRSDITPLKSDGMRSAGGTDVYVRSSDDLAEQNIQYLHEHNKIILTSEKVIIGAGVTVSQLWESDELIEILPLLRTHLRLISSKQIRNMATVAGNFVNASPIGDLSVLFLALNSELTIRNNSGSTRKLPLKSFFLDYKTIDLHPDELIETIEFEKPKSNFFYNFEKVSKRQYLDIASVNSAISFSFDKQILKNVNIAIGGVSAVPKYLTKTSEFLSDKKIDENLFREANDILQSEISPISDIRGTESYKRLLAKQLLFQHFLVFTQNMSA